MTEEKIVEEADSTKTTAEEVETPKEEVIDWQARALEAEAQAQKAKATADNYKREIEVKELRKKERMEKIHEPSTPNEATLDESQVQAIQNDFNSKREDVIDELQGDIVGLDEEEWNKVRARLNGELSSVLSESIRKEKYTARGEIKRAIVGLIEYAKSDATRRKDLEAARIKGMKEQTDFEAAEIGGVGKKSAPKGGIEIKDVDKEYSENSGGAFSPERAAKIRESREARLKDYAPDTN